MTITKINPTLDCGVAQMRAQCRHLGTVVTITGRIDVDNAKLVEQRARRYVLMEKPVVFDLSGLDFVAEQGLSLLNGLQTECDAKGVDWCMIPGDRVAELLWRTGNEDEFPVAHSVAEALKSFSDAVNARRRLLPILTKTA